MSESESSPRPKRRRLRRVARGLALGLAILALLVALAFPYLVHALGGASRKTAYDGLDTLSPAARALLDEVYAGLDPARLVDYHTHVAGQGHGSDCWVNPRMVSLWHPVPWIQYRFYLSAAGVDDPDGQDAQFTDELAKLARAGPHPSKHLILAFDYRHDEDGERDLERSEFHVPNAYVWEVAARYPDVFLPAMSVHPYRKDALAELEKWAGRGGRLVKWLPSAMGIDPASPLCDSFYERMVELDVTLLTHGGLEKAVEAEEDQELSNPLRLRRALALGVKVVVAHCASTGKGIDLDHPGAERRSCFRYFMEMMGEERYVGLLFGELSTITQTNRYGNALAELLARSDLHGRLVNGSDYPLPAINVLYRTGALCGDGFLTEPQREALNELYDYNPLVFDLALKRTVAHPVTGARFAAAAFLGKEGLGY